MKYRITRAHKNIHLTDIFNHCNDCSKKFIIGEKIFSDLETNLVFCLKCGKAKIKKFRKNFIEIENELNRSNTLKKNKFEMINKGK